MEERERCYSFILSRTPHETRLKVIHSHSKPNVLLNTKVPLILIQLSSDESVLFKQEVNNIKITFYFVGGMLSCSRAVDINQYDVKF
jgi:hypothetical protein